MNKVLVTAHLAHDLSSALAASHPESLFILSDALTHEVCVPAVRGIPVLQTIATQEIVIPMGDEHKTLATATQVWHALQTMGATRHSLLITVGGGMTTDLGGFCASCFKRGIPFINIPTSLLAMVDASLGGKTGVNLGSIKNEIGVFREPLVTIIDPTFLNTLDDENLRSGYAEMLKHGLLSDAATLAALLTCDLQQFDLSLLGPMIEQSVAVKAAIVAQDPLEQGLRQALNLGHTVGHAIESLCLRRSQPLLHGYAVAYGIIAELFLSAIKTGFPQTILRQVVTFIRQYYGAAPITCADYPALLELMSHDKKNTRDQITFTLLRDVGAIELGQHAAEEEIREALDFLREG